MQIVEGESYFEVEPLSSLSSLLKHSRDLFGTRPAVRFRERPEDKDSIERCYQDLYADVRALQLALTEMDLRGKRIAVVGDNSYPWMCSYLAVACDFGTIVPLDRLLPVEELQQLLLRSEASCLIYDASFHADLAPLLPACPQLLYALAMQKQREKKVEALESSQEYSLAAPESRPLFADYQAVLARGREIYESGAETERELTEPLDPEAAMAIIFTSGTSDQSKAVLLNQRALCGDVMALMRTVRFKDPLHTLSILPLHHTFENTCGFLTVLALGGCIHVYDGLRYIAKNLKEYRVHMLVGVPTIFEMLYKKLNSGIRKAGQEKKFKAGLRLSRFLRFWGIDRRRQIFRNLLEELGGELYICISGAAALDTKIIRFFDDIGVEILQGYGMTECAPVIAGCNTQVNHFGTVGQPLAGVQVAIDHEKAGEPGEILIKGPMCMLGYYQNDEANQEVFDAEGWLHSGDIGYFDKHHCLRLTGRCKSMIVLRSGKKVFPEELEKMLNEHAYVRDSLVIGQEDENGDVVLTAKIVLDLEKLNQEKSNETVDVAQLIQSYIDSTNEALPSFKGIRSFVYSFNDMVRTTTLKVRRGVESEQLKQLIAQSRLSWREISGQNVDELMQKNGGASETASSELSKTDQVVPTPAGQQASAATGAAGEVRNLSKREQKKQLKQKLRQDLQVLLQERHAVALAEKKERELLKTRYQADKETLYNRYLQQHETKREEEKKLRRDYREALEKLN